MNTLEKKHQIMGILAANLNTSQPGLVASKQIAAKLNMSRTATCQLLKSMHEMGLVVSDMEGENSLITLEGLNSLSA